MTVRSLQIYNPNDTSDKVWLFWLSVKLFLLSKLFQDFQKKSRQTGGWGSEVMECTWEHEQRVWGWTTVDEEKWVDLQKSVNTDVCVCVCVSGVFDSNIHTFSVKSSPQFSAASPLLLCLSASQMTQMVRKVDTHTHIYLHTYIYIFPFEIVTKDSKATYLKSFKDFI